MTPAYTQAERDLQTAVIDLARWHGWRVTHFRPALVGGRWVTPIQGDRGWPDLAIAGYGRLIIAELKAAGKRPEPEQVAWLDLLAVGPAETYCWQPGDWASGAVGRVLTPLYDPTAGTVPQWPTTAVVA